MGKSIFFITTKVFLNYFNFYQDYIMEEVILQAIMVNSLKLLRVKLNNKFKVG
jgi:hypothetical protein